MVFDDCDMLMLAGGAHWAETVRSVVFGHQREGTWAERRKGPLEFARGPAERARVDLRKDPSRYTEASAKRADTRRRNRARRLALAASYRREP